MCEACLKTAGLNNGSVDKTGVTLVVLLYYTCCPAVHSGDGKEDTVQYS